LHPPEPSALVDIKADLKKQKIEEEAEIISPNGMRRSFRIPHAPIVSPNHAEPGLIAKKFDETIRIAMCIPPGVGYVLATDTGSFVDLSQPWTLKRERKRS